MGIIQNNIFTGIALLFFFKCFNVVRPHIESFVVTHSPPVEIENSETDTKKKNWPNKTQTIYMIR